MRRNVGRNRNIYLFRTQDYNTGDLLKIEVAQIQEKLFGYATNFHKSRKCVVFETFPSRNGHLGRPKRVPNVSSKSWTIQYFNLFFKAYIKTTTESSKIVGPGTCQTRALLMNGPNGFLRNIFCSDLSLIRCGYDYVTLCNVIIPTAN